MGIGWIGDKPLFEEVVSVVVTVVLELDKADGVGVDTSLRAKEAVTTVNSPDTCEEKTENNKESPFEVANTVDILSRPDVVDGSAVDDISFFEDVTSVGIIPELCDESKDAVDGSSTVEEADIVVVVISVLDAIDDRTIDESLLCESLVEEITADAPVEVPDVVAVIIDGVLAVDEAGVIVDVQDSDEVDRGSFIDDAVLAGVSILDAGDEEIINEVSLLETVV